MAKTYFVKSDEGSNFLPVADATLSTRTKSNYLMDNDLETGVFCIIFLDSNKEPVTPTGGTIVPEMSTFAEGQWLGPSAGDTTINATDVSNPNASYNIPVFNGPATEGRITLAGITGATYCKAYFWRA